MTGSDVVVVDVLHILYVVCLDMRRSVKLELGLEVVERGNPGRWRYSREREREIELTLN